MILLNNTPYRIVSRSIHGITLESKCGKVVFWTWEVAKRRGVEK
jgi:hypothetical protein